MRDKIELTRQLVEKLPPDSWTVDQARITWWYNFRDSGGMRLTNIGYETFTKILDLERYEYHVQPFDITSRMIIALDRKLQQPWYVKFHKQMPKTLVFFGSKEAMMANLYGDLKRFIDSYQ